MLGSYDVVLIVLLVLLVVAVTERHHKHKKIKHKVKRTLHLIEGMKIHCKELGAKNFVGYLETIENSLKE